MNRASKIAAAAAVVMPALIVSEGLETTPYYDQAGILTVCVGETRVEMRQYTRAECEELLGKAYLEFANGVVDIIGHDFPVATLASAIHFAYNIGLGAFKTSTAARLFIAGDIEGACKQYRRWVYITVDGKKVVSNGLNNRRIWEESTCLSGLAEPSQPPPSPSLWQRLGWLIGNIRALWG